MALTEGDAQFGQRFLVLSRNSFVLAGITAMIAVFLALIMAYGARLSKTTFANGLNRLVGLGYAVPGAVIAVGVLIPVTRLDNWLAGQWELWFGHNPGLLLTGGIAALIYAYLARFLGVALHTVETSLAKITPNAARQFVDPRLAGFCRCDERVAGDAGHAAIQFRHTGDADLHAGFG